jgi:nucleoside-diphosphate-sugar epimerase
MTHILVFGKNGFIGKNFCNFLSIKKIQHTSYSSKDIDLLQEESSKKLKFITKKSYQIFFFSALTPDKGKDEVTLIKNITMIKNFFAYFPKENIDHFFYISSDAVYSLDNDVITDKTVPNPQDLYGLMHLTREKIVESHLPREKIIILRLTGVYGLGDTHNSYGPNRFIKSAIVDKEIKLFGNGQDKRSHIHISYVINILYINLLNKISGTYCVASKKSYTFLELAKKIQLYLKKRNILIKIINIENISKKTKRVFRNLLLHKKFSHIKELSISEGLELYISIYLKKL